MSASYSRINASLVILAIASGVAPVQAQRVEVTTRRAAPRAELSDSVERVVKGLQHKLDSLTRVYNESDDLSSAERRHLAEAITGMVTQLRPMIIRFSDDGPDHAAPSGMLRMQVTGAAAERSVAAIQRALTQARETDAIPRGWIGFVTEGASVQWVDGGQYFVRYLSYPRILSVDPSSPAQRAGIEPSDTLIAYDGHDVRSNDISLTQMLRPNAKLNVRIRRDGKTRDVAVTVARAPSRIVLRRDDETRGDASSWALAGVPDAPRFPRSSTLPPPSTAVSAPRVLLAPPVPGIQNAPLRVQPAYAFSFSSNGVAGAQLLSISEDMGRAIGIGSGVLVTISPTGSPANESGLRDGDVLTKVGGQAVRTVAEVRELVGLANDNGDRTVDVEIVRAKKAMKLALKW
ncbi:MAG: hypothetical protein JWM95_1105 [Gemmatimonadetes bacterium]|nr:hypothetical protein [Gemmatimonadota bacterium]